MLTPQDKGRLFGKELAKRLGEDCTPGSGNGSDKGDSRKRHRGGRFLTEAKWTATGKYKFTLDDWYTHETHALKVFMEPVFIISFNWKTEVAIISQHLVDSQVDYWDTVIEEDTDLFVRGKESFTISKVPAEGCLYHFTLGNEDFTLVNLNDYIKFKGYYEQQ